jgi:hypothetical protein
MTERMSDEQLLQLEDERQYEEILTECRRISMKGKKPAAEAAPSEPTPDWKPAE